MLATGTTYAVDLELVNELLDVDLYRRIADVVGFRRDGFGYFLFRILFVLVF